MEEERGRRGRRQRREEFRIQCVPSTKSQWSHIFRERLTYDGEDEGVREMVVERQLHVVLPQTQRSSRGHKRREDVERLLRNFSSTVKKQESSCQDLVSFPDPQYGTC